MKTNRRTALALTASGLAAALTGLTGSTAHATPSKIARLGERFENAHRRFDHACSERNKLEAAFQATYGSVSPEWEAPNAVALGWPSMRRTFRTVEEALERFNDAIAEQAAKVASGIAPVGLVNQLKAAREAAVEALIEQEAAYAPIAAKDDLATRASAVADRVLQSLIAAPCATLDDVRTKAAILARRDADCWPIRGEEFATLLATFAGEA